MVGRAVLNLFKSPPASFGSVSRRTSALGCYCGVLSA